MATFEIRDATMPDVAGLRKVFRRSSLSNAGDRALLLANPQALELSDVQIRQGRTRLAEDAAGRMIGFITTELEGAVVEIEDLFVDPEWMRHGVGRALVLDAVATARKHSAPRLEVTANTHALGFYTAVGFSTDGVVETQFGPGLRMHLDIPPEAGRPTT